MSARIKTLGDASYEHDNHAMGPQHAGNGEPVDDRPRSVYELMTRRMLDEMREDVNDIKGRVNALLWMVAGAVLLELIMRIIK
jgi:hypothetical protein